jgi:gas vesicle protein
LAQWLNRQWLNSDNSHFRYHYRMLKGESPMTEYERFGEYAPSDRSKVGTALTFLFVGLGVGALTALLFAPKSGRQLRKTLRRGFEDAREVLDDWTDQAGDIARRGADLAGQARERITPLTKAVRKQL